MKPTRCEYRRKTGKDRIGGGIRRQRLGGWGLVFILITASGFPAAAGSGLETAGAPAPAPAPASGKPVMTAGPDRRVSFNRDIRPILSENCYHCHGFDPSGRKAELRLDTAEGAAEKGAVVPGKPEESELVRRIFAENVEEIMPPPDSHRRLGTGQKELLRRWIAEGAAYEPHWAFIPPPAVVPLPEVKDVAWPRTGIDRFVLARLEQEGLRPSTEAPRERWLRRVTFDLTGLPPAQAEVDAFLADGAADACGKVVDRLLASPRFGERMAVPWLDLARYADSYGYQADVDTGAWPWRDWVVRALNGNLPWDQFITWQIAGDLLPGATRDQRLATAFNRIHRKTNEGGSIEEEFLQEGVSDRVHTFGTVFLALTLECARCHDHKYDPITAQDYYSLGAFFNSIDEAGVMQYATGILPQPALALPTPAEEEAIRRAEAELAREEQALRDWPARNGAAWRKWLEDQAGRPEAVWPLTDLAADFPLEEIVEGRLANAVEGGNPASAGGFELVAGGREGKAARLNGDDALTLPLFGIRHAWQPVSVSFWMRPAADYPRAVIFANSSGSDVNYSGYELVLENGGFSWSVIRESPANAAAVRTPPGVVRAGEWIHVTAVYDGSMRAAGLRLYLNGRPADLEVVRDRLSRDYQSGSALQFGARMRDSGLKEGLVDSIRIFRRAVTEAEAGDLSGGLPLPVLAEKARDSLRNDGPGPAGTGEMLRMRDYYFAAVQPEARAQAARVQSARDRLGEAWRKVREIPVMEEREKRPAFVLERGAYDAPGKPAPRAVPAVLPPLPPGAPADRLGLAGWLTDPGHPLTARVLMNRLWQEFFGQGLVATVDNFGMQGALPSHPELLDWLAREFTDSGWDFKAACRRIVLSAVYRQDSRGGEALRERDPDNVLLARGPSRRLTAEMLRDSALALGGLLGEDQGGPPALPYQPEGSMWQALNNFLPPYREDTGAGLHRRSLYTFWRRTTTPPNMMALDAVARETCVARRQTTNTPLQPLVLLNDPQFVEAARALGARMLQEGGGTDAERAGWLFREVSGRTASGPERELVQALLVEQRELFRAAPDQAAALLKTGHRPADAALDPVEAAAAAVTAAAVFNLDASLMLR